MIWYWIRLAYLRLRWLFIYPAARDLAQHNIDAACPCCGHRSGSLRCVHREAVRAQSTGQPDIHVMVQHTCKVCGARWHDEPVVKSTPGAVWQHIEEPITIRSRQGVA